MRILGYINHPQYKITVFKMDNRVTLKLENEGYEQSYKLGEREHLNSLEKIKLLIDDHFLHQAATVFQAMHQNIMSASARNTAETTENRFPEII
jgi:hypothetical protein